MSAITASETEDSSVPGRKVPTADWYTKMPSITANPTTPAASTHTDGGGCHS